MMVIPLLFLWSFVLENILIIHRLIVFKIHVDTYIYIHKYMQKCILKFVYNDGEQQKDMEPKCSSYERVSEMSSSSLSETSTKEPNLEFTLGRAQ